MLLSLVHASTAIAVTTVTAMPKAICCMPITTARRTGPRTATMLNIATASTATTGASGTASSIHAAITAAGGDRRAVLDRAASLRVKGLRYKHVPAARLYQRGGGGKA